MFFVHYTAKMYITITIKYMYSSQKHSFELSVLT